MPSQPANITLGTAGHIDHGKTALVKCLTGCETDRLKAEKERGMSIELGFAPCTIAGTQVGIVDVPGHENFVKTMVAGATGMDGVVLVVAADDGVMPQTREHLDILTLLGVRHGMVALTKIDRVDPEQVELAREELHEFLQGTFLEGSPICPVSSLSGEGFDAFYQALESLVGAVRPKSIDGVFRLPVDRAFSLKGHGTVVSGIPVAGQARIGDEVVLLPQGLAGTIRAAEVYGRKADAVMAGQCAALNVRHWDQRQIRRGDTLAAPGYFSAQEWFVCKLRLLPQEKLALKNGAHVKFHTGTAEVPAAVYLMKGSRMEAGEEQFVQVKTATPLVAGPGDHFILRTLSPVRTVGGGTVIEGGPRRLKRTRPGLHDDLQEWARAVGNESRLVELCVRRPEALAASEAQIAVRAKILPDRLREVLAALLSSDKVLTLAPGLYVHRDTAAEAGERLVETVRDFHRRSPESPGLGLKQLGEVSGIDRPVLEGLVALLKAQGRLIERKERLAAPEHRPTFQEDDAKCLEAVEAVFRRRAFRPPSPEELVEATGSSRPAIDKAMKILQEHQRLVPVAPGLLFHREAVAAAREILVAHIRQEGRLESVRFKYLLDTTRKYALPLLDYFDRAGLLRRAGNTRYLKEPG